MLNPLSNLLTVGHHSTAVKLINDANISEVFASFKIYEVADEAKAFEAFASSRGNLFGLLGKLLLDAFGALDYLRFDLVDVNERPRTITIDDVSIAERQHNV